MWSETSQDIIKNLYPSMPDRISLCNRARGDSTGNEIPQWYNSQWGVRTSVPIFGPEVQEQMNDLTRDPQCLVPNQAWYSFIDPLKG
ncbi:hypothetical protein TNCV_2533681 [Trichonephila clavipes]|nr:hypothetical protein TNCV_2533681 [Trichonephila clavipes]